MGIDKAELKILVANDIGASMEDKLEAAQRLEHQYEGGQMALDKVKVNLSGIIGVLKKDLEEGSLDPKGLELTDAQRVHDFIKKWLGRCFVSVQGTKDKERAGQLGAAGMVSGIKKCMEVPLKVMETERAKMEAVKVAIEAGPDTVGANGKPLPRAPGARPADPLATVRARGVKVKKNGKAKKAVAKVTKKVTKRKCSVCKKPGHTSRTCPKGN